MRRARPGAPCASCALHDIFLESRALGRGGSCEPRAIVDHVRAVAPQFLRGVHGDAHELLGSLLGAVSGPDPHPSLWGELANVVTCTECGTTSTKRDSFTTLSLEFGRAASVQDMLGNFCAVEQLRGANMYRCEATCGNQLVGVGVCLGVWGGRGSCQVVAPGSMVTPALQESKRTSPLSLRLMQSDQEKK